MESTEGTRTIDVLSSPDLLVEHEALVTEALRRAVRQALREHKRAGNTIAGWENDHVVLIAAKDIVVDEEEADRPNGSA